ncbi:2-oxoglutarate dehydrogenase mitochondrial, partial [Taenia solium]
IRGPLTLLVNRGFEGTKCRNDPDATTHTSKLKHPRRQSPVSMFYPCITQLVRRPCQLNRWISCTVRYQHKSAAEPFLNGTSSNYIEDIYAAWLKDPNSVHKSWDVYFRNVSNGTSVGAAYTTPPTLGFEQFGVQFVPPMETTVSAGVSAKSIQDHLTVQMIIRSYQVRGHLAAKLDPLNIKTSIESARDIVYGRYLGEIVAPDLNKVFRLPLTTHIGGDQTELPFREIIKRLEDAYCQSIGVDYMFINDLKKCDWLRQRFETPGVTKLSIGDRKLLLYRLTHACKFEEYLAKKWSSEKRFGIEGCEVLIPAMKTVIDESVERGVESFVIGMAHRGRLNVLANVCHKPLSDIFCQFDPNLKPADEGSGDVKYHLGMSQHWINRKTGKEFKIAVCANPSHLEAVDPVAQGKTRAEQFYRKDESGKQVMPILLHGDASFAGQGIVYETIHLSNLPSYTTRGTIHIVVNNQIGFTTDPRMSRSSNHCTDVARVTDSPIFHVNADDPDAVVHVARVAAEWRATFGHDVVIDLVGYRRFGHNETDEPMFTQPLMYKRIRQMPTVLEKYSKQLLAEGIITEQEFKDAIEAYHKQCDDAYAEARAQTVAYNRAWIDSPWENFFDNRDPMNLPSTGVEESQLNHIGEVVSGYPSNFVVHPGLKRVLKGRAELVKSRMADWALGELFAYGSLLMSGNHVRVSGQDVERGTFSHRHAVLHHQDIDKSVYVPLEHLSPDQAPFTICNSSLSEYAVMGFEMGYSLTNPNSLVIWEAQFGDFANGAQSIIDLYVSSGQQKWVRQSNLVLLLPHGMEGMGPEHSSGRLERFLQLSNDDESHIPVFGENFSQEQLFETNWIIVNSTTPANMFHVLRRQILLPFRRPLVVFTPKSLLRHPDARSSFDDMLPGTGFQRLIPEAGPAREAPENVKKLIFCSGKVYYEIKKHIDSADCAKEIAVARVEQLTPLPYDLIKEELERYPNAAVQWVQEEHRNQGAWTYVRPRIEHLIQREMPNRVHTKLLYVGRPASAAPATGRKAIHLMENSHILKAVLKTK